MSRIDQWLMPAKIYDAHCHFFDYSTIQRFAKQNGFESIDEFIKSLPPENRNFEIPPKDPKKLAEKWINELDAKGCDKAVLFPGWNKINAMQIAVEEYPDRFIPYMMLNPLEENAMEILNEAISKVGIKGFKLYPVSHYYHLYEDRILPFYEIAQENNLIISIHIGLSIGRTADMRYMNPSDLSPVARDFSKINFLLAHFAPGYFRELLFLMYHYDNVFAETSSSNRWMEYLPYSLNLNQVFRKVIDVKGVDHLIFGTDSTMFPRGWRRAIFDGQIAVCNELGLNQGEIDQIFFKNLENLILK